MKKKDTTLEDILLEMANSKETIKESVNKMKNNLLNEEMKKNLMEDEDEEDEDEDLDMSDEEMDDDMPDMEDDMSGDEDESDEDMELDMPEMDEDEIGEVDFADKGGDDMSGLMTQFNLVVDENGDYHATLTPEEIEQLVEQLPEQAEIIMVKKPAYEVTVKDLASMPDDTEIEIDDDEFEQGMASLGASDEDDEFDMDDMEGDDMEDDEFEMDDDEMEDEDDEPVKKEGYNKSMKESLLVKRNKLYEKVIRDLNNKIGKYEKALNESNKKISAMKSALVEGKSIIGQLTVINENLSNVTQLFGKYHLTAKQRTEILEGFAKVSTANESKLLKEVYEKQFLNTSGKTPLKKSEILENKGGQKIVVKENNMKEKAPQKSQSDFFRFTNHSI